MDNLQFTNEAVAGMVTQGVLMMLIPIIMLIIWQVKTHYNIAPVVIGAATWFVFAIVLKIAPAYFLIQADNPVAKAVSGNIWLSFIVAGLLAGVFEETGRFLALRFVLKKYAHRRTAISYGIGHGGFESIYIGFQTLSLAVVGILLSSGHADMILGNNTDEATISLVASQLQPYANVVFSECMLGVFERLPAITVHIAFSVLVFAAVRERRYLHLYPVAVILHALFDFSIVFYRAGYVSVWVMELGLAVIAVLIALFTSRIYKKLGEAEQDMNKVEIATG